MEQAHELIQGGSERSRQRCASELARLWTVLWRALQRAAFTLV